LAKVVAVSKTLASKLIKTGLLVGGALIVLGSAEAAWVQPAFAAAAGKGTGALWNELIGILETIINILLKAGGVAAIALLVIGGIQYMMSGGDKMGTQQARSTITFSIVGLVIVLVSYLAVRILVHEIFNVNVSTPV